MLTKVTARHFELTPELRTKAEAELTGLSKFFENIISAELVLDIERHRRTAELRVSVYKDILSGSGESDDMYRSIDMAVEKVKTQLKKYKGKLKEKDPEAIAGKMERLTRPQTNPDEVDV